MSEIITPCKPYEVRVSQGCTVSRACTLCGRFQCERCHDRDFCVHCGDTDR